MGQAYNSIQITYLPKTDKMRRLYPNLIAEVEKQDKILNSDYYVLTNEAYKEWKAYQESEIEVGNHDKN